MGRPGAFAEKGSNLIIQNCNLYLSIVLDFHLWSQAIMLMISLEKQKNYG